MDRELTDREILDRAIEVLAETARHKLSADDFTEPHRVDRARLAALCAQAAAGFLHSMREEKDPFGAPGLWEQLGEEYMRRAIQEYERQGRPT
ncbi:hypothetical protein ACQEVX_22985 [Streptomyces syringium]|uniref:hypothetical protein n=1 Tax=Streptomyces syringium TaxID=76729 RepID=UPI003D9339AB